MNKTWMIVIVAGVCLVLALVIYFCMSVSYKNREVQLRNLIKTKQTDNKSEFDNVWKKISQVAEVTDGQKEALKEIIIGYAQARGSGGGTIAKSIHEAIPNVDTSTFNNLQNIIVSARDGFTRRQKELLDYKREHDNLLDSPISGWFLSGKEHIDVTIVTSSRTEKSFDTGKDDDVDVFKHKQPAEK